MIILRQKRYSEESDEEKKYRKKVKARKKQKEGMNVLNSVVAGTGLAGAIGVNEAIKEDTKYRIGRKVSHKEYEATKRKYDRLSKFDEALKPTLEAWDKHHEKRMNEYRKAAAEQGIPFGHRLQYELGESIKHSNETLDWSREQRKKAREIADRLLEKEQSDAKLAGDRLYKKTAKKVNKRTALITGGIAAPAIALGIAKRRKRDKDLTAKNPKNKEK